MYFTIKPKMPVCDSCHCEKEQILSFCSHCFPMERSWTLVNQHIICGICKHSFKKYEKGVCKCGRITVEHDLQRKKLAPFRGKELKNSYPRCFNGLCYGEFPVNKKMCVECCKFIYETKYKVLDIDMTCGDCGKRLKKKQKSPNVWSNACKCGGLSYKYDTRFYDSPMVFYKNPYINNNYVKLTLTPFSYS